MLVLTRRLGQIITLGDPAGPELPIEVTVIEMRGDQVRLGITAPRGISVDRTEVRQQKQLSTPWKAGLAVDRERYGPSVGTVGCAQVTEIVLADVEQEIESPVGSMRE